MSEFLQSDNSFDDDSASFSRPQRQPISSDQKLDRVTKRSASKVLDYFAIGQAHLHKSYRDAVLATDVEYASFLAFIQ